MMGAPTNPICELLGIRYPIIQGAMAWIADAALAAAVSNAGGLGTIAAGNAPPDMVRGWIKKTRELTDKPFAVNIMMLSPNVAEVTDIVVEERVPIVITGAGSPLSFAARIKENGIKFVPVIPSTALAVRMQKNGADAIIAEGMEAGGHIGKMTTMALVPQVVDAVSVPVLAAGGIADGRGMAAAFMLGACGVQIGTRFIVAKESPAHQSFKDKVIKAKDIDTEVTGQITGHPMRQLRNKFTVRYNAMEQEELKKDEPDMTKFMAMGAGSLRVAAVDGDVDNGSLMAGQISGLITKEQTCDEIVQEIMNQFYGLVGVNK
ncbi:MAG: enoyl-[acyl-carrier-protein] reductase FabK [Defluviitaleaceae bacterium]|nr:enoyl-[acyl-carrier-protein] reductase FabK [Defluviitaleaceae bacterium]MCL2837258.1 enoyl-[acyl-carrier-protein] reductase FabK [Defluviitaleaceae bacterium]